MNKKKILIATAYVICTTLLVVTLAYGCNSPQGSSNTNENVRTEYSSKQSSSSSSMHSEDYSEKWKEFAGTTYKATQFVNSDACNNYAFSFSRSGSGTYIVFGTMPGTHVVTDQMEFNIYKVESDANCLYLYCSELSTPVKIKIKGHSLYTYDGKERYSKWD